MKLSKYDIKGDLEITSLDENEEILFVKLKAKYEIDRITQGRYWHTVERYQRQMKKFQTFGLAAGMGASKLVKMMGARPTVSRTAQVLMIDDVHQVDVKHVNYLLTSAPESPTKNLQDWFTGSLLTKEDKS